MSFTKVSLIDDDPSHIKLGTMALKKARGKEVTSFQSGEEFLTLVCLGLNSYDVILIDVNMPNLLGTDVVDQLALNPSFNNPIIFLTGTTDETEVKNLYN
jgi:CheY-like chemotaxis protein